MVAPAETAAPVVVEAHSFSRGDRWFLGLAATVALLAWLGAWLAPKSAWLLEEWSAVPLPTEWFWRLAASVLAMLSVVRLVRWWNADPPAARGLAGFRNLMRLGAVVVGGAIACAAFPCAAERLEKARADRAVESWASRIAASDPAAATSAVFAGPFQTEPIIQALRIGLGARDAGGWHSEAELWWVPADQSALVEPSSWSSARATHSIERQPGASIAPPPSIRALSSKAHGEWFVVQRGDKGALPATQDPSLKPWRGGAR